MSEQTEQTIEETSDKDMNQTDVDSKYRKIILAAQRSKQLQRGAIPRVDMDIRKSKPTRIAMKELEEDQIEFDETPVSNVSQAS